MDINEIAELVLTGRFALLWFLFHVVSWAYNALIDRLHWREDMDNWTWLTVVIGVGYTLVAAGVVLWGFVGHGSTAVVVVFLMFVGTGIPMVAGDIRRVWVWGTNGNAVIAVFPEVENGQHDDRPDAENDSAATAV
jgi:hypothetical protein